MILPPRRSLALVSEAAYHECTIKADNTEILIGETEDFMIWGFRGTTFDGIDIIRDLRAFPWWSKEIQTFVHKGFLVGVRAIWPLLPLGMNTKPIILTGHSKGGAEAILCGAFLCGLGRPPAMIETFGAPRVAFGGAWQNPKRHSGQP